MSTETETRAEHADEVTYCYGHPDTPTRLRCSRCDRPICGRCAIPASVGQHCPECVAEARKSAPKVRATLQANAPVVHAIIAINVLVFVAQMTTGFDQSSPVSGKFRLDPFAVWLGGEWWRLFTSMFLHASVLHIFLNMYILYLYGPNVEQAFGSVRFALMYVAAGFAGSAASFAFPPHASSVGASGAIFGVVGILLVYLYNRRASTFMGHYLRGMLTFVGINMVIGFLPGLNIDWVAHLGGLAGGVLLGLGFDRSSTSEARSPLQLQVAAFVLVVGVSTYLVTAGPFALAP